MWTYSPWKRVMYMLYFITITSVSMFTYKYVGLCRLVALTKGNSTFLLAYIVQLCRYDMDGI